MKFNKIAGITIALILTSILVWKFSDRGGKLQILVTVPILEKPVPLEIRDVKNKILGYLKEGDEVVFSDKVIEKDYAYYEIKFKNTKGFIIYQNSMMREIH